MSTLRSALAPLLALATALPCAAQSAADAGPERVAPPGADATPRPSGRHAVAAPERAELAADPALAPILEADDRAAALAAAGRALVFARRSGRPVERSRAAAAMLAAGLREEARDVLELVLDSEPDEPVARALVAAHDLAPEIPAWHDEPASADALRALLVHRGAAADACGRERALQELARTSGRQRRALLADLERFLHDARPGARRFALLALRRLAPGEQLARVQRHAVLDREEAVRREAARALRDAADPAAVAPVSALLDEPLPLLRARAAETLAVAGYAAAVPGLLASFVAPPAPPSGSGDGRPTGAIFVGTQRAYVQGYEAEVAQSAAVANPIVGVLQEGASLSGTVQGVTSLGGVGFGAAQGAVRAALEELTGERFPSAGAWERWWEREGRARFEPPTRDGPAAARTAAGG